MKIVAHDSSFHSDDVFAVATLLLIVPNAEVIRSRQQTIIDEADYVVDVGFVYDPSKKRFDHHQLGGAGQRENGIPYASFGLVWKEYGVLLAGGEREAALIDRELVQPIDSHDNGNAIAEYKYKNVREYTIGDYFSSFLIDSGDEEGDNINIVFLQVVQIAKELLIREIKKARSSIAGEDLLMKIYTESLEKRVIELPTEALPWRIILGALPEPVYIVYERRDKNWGIKAVPDLTKPYGYNRKDLPHSWAGKTGNELAQITGVPDALFAHRAFFMASAKSKEGALALANIAINA